MYLLLQSLMRYLMSNYYPTNILTFLDELIFFQTYWKFSTKSDFALTKNLLFEHFHYFKKRRGNSKRFFKKKEAIFRNLAQKHDSILLLIYESKPHFFLHKSINKWIITRNLQQKQQKKPTLELLFFLSFFIVLF